MPEFLFAAVPHQEAIDFIRSKPVMSRDVFDKLLPDLQARAFTIAGGIPANVMQRVRDFIADIPAGQTWDAQKDLIVNQLAPYFVDPNATEEVQAEQLAAAEAKAELLLRINGQETYAVAAHQVMMRNLGTHPYWQYETMGDDRVRATHAALDGLILPAESRFWQYHNPPWEWGCRCLKIPRSRGDVAAERVKDAQRPLEKQRVLDGPLLRELELNNRLVRGMNSIVSVAPPQGPGAFRFNPDLGLKIDIAQLRAKYSPEVWNAFEQWAAKTKLPDGRTVYEWMAGEPLPAVPIPAAPAPEKITVAGARKSPVSAAIDIKIRDKVFRGQMAQTLEAIDLAHDDGAMPALALRSHRGAALGELNITDSEIGVKASGQWRGLTLAHEVGHALDYYAIGQRLRFSSEIDPALAAWRDAVDGSASMLRIRQAPGIPNRTYFASRREQFARSYAQYIAYKTKNPALLTDVDTILKGNQPWRQWEWEDFAPIAQAFDDFFTAQGWQP